MHLLLRRYKREHMHNPAAPAPLDRPDPANPPLTFPHARTHHHLLQAGSLIVEALRTYRQPAIIYLPPGCELRGGAWVVIDSQINSEMVEMYADPTARGGVLEPEVRSRGGREAPA